MDSKDYFNFVSGIFAAPVQTARLAIVPLSEKYVPQLTGMINADGGDFQTHAAGPQFNRERKPLGLGYVQDQLFPHFQTSGQKIGKIDRYLALQATGDFVGRLSLWRDVEGRTRLSPYILPSHRLSGLAVEAYNAVAGHARAANLFPDGQIRAEVSVGNAPSMAFYRKLGFREAGIIDTPAAGLAPDKQRRFVLLRDF